ncbi:MAG: alpha/beta fold hydrolase, partial [Serratia proteamaculans]
LVLIDPPVSGPGRREYPGRWPWYVDSIRQSLLGMNAEQMRTYCPNWSESQRQLRAEWLHTCYEPAIQRAYEDFHQVDSHRDYPALSMPTLLMVAGLGGVIQQEDEAEIRALQPEITLAHVENAGHMIPWDDFDGFFRALGNFLD